MDKQAFIDKISMLPGVGAVKAEALYDAGFDSLEKVTAATSEELQAVEGIGPKVADAIIAGLAVDSEEGSGEIQVVETGKKTAQGKKTKTAVKAEVVEPEAVYAPKIKAEIPDHIRDALIVRSIRAAQQPAFRRYHHYYRIGLDSEVWRKPKGLLSKQRRGMGYRPSRVKVGFGKPAITRGLHPSGFEEVLVHNVNDLDVIENKTQAARIAGKVGTRKRKLIEEAAAAKSIRVLNPRRN